MRKIKVSFFERSQLQEEISREIYEQMGYTIDKSKFPEDYMEVSRHPMEIACYRAAGKILQRFTKGE